MGQLVIQDVDDGLIDSLRCYAAQHHYSLEEMLKEILAKAISSKIMDLPGGIDSSFSGRKRVPPFQFKGRVREFGDVLTSVSHSDWQVS
ncbi:MAG: hypothetical protein H7839_11110 [Magnetococcus sp. YQC-5]